MTIANIENESDLLYNAESTNHKTNGVLFCIDKDKLKMICGGLCFEITNDYFMNNLNEVLKERAALLSRYDNGTTFLDKLISYGKAMQDARSKAQFSLFGESQNGIEKPENTGTIFISEQEMLEMERSVIGLYLTSHPIDEFCYSINKHVKDSDGTKTIKTKKYGIIPYFDDISDLIDSRHNKGCIAVICSVLSHKQIRSGNVNTVHIATHKQSYEFMEKEFGGGHMKMNNIASMQPHQAYFLVMQKEKDSNNRVIILDNFKINKNGTN